MSWCILRSCEHTPWNGAARKLFKRMLLFAELLPNLTDLELFR